MSSKREARNFTGLYLSGVKSAVEDPELVERRRTQIVMAAIKTFSKRGFHDTTVKDIAKEAKVSPGLIYQYVQDKQDVLFLALMHVVNENNRDIPRAIASTHDPVLQFIAVVDAYCRVNETNREAVSLTYRETKSLVPKYRDALKQMELETNQLISGVIWQCIQNGYFRRVNVEIATYAMVVMAHSWATKYWRFRRITSIDEYINENVNILLRGLFTDKGLETYKHLLAPEEPAKKAKSPTRMESRIIASVNPARVGRGVGKRKRAGRSEKSALGASR